jgi:hypothetical protein
MLIFAVGTDFVWCYDVIWSCMPHYRRFYWENFWMSKQRFSVFAIF